MVPVGLQVGIFGILVFALQVQALAASYTVVVDHNCSKKVSEFGKAMLVPGRPEMERAEEQCS